MSLSIDEFQSKKVLFLFKKYPYWLPESKVTSYLLPVSPMSEDYVSAMPYRNSSIQTDAGLTFTAEQLQLAENGKFGKLCTESCGKALTRWQSIVSER